jgi:hypothetical protein
MPLTAFAGFAEDTIHVRARNVATKMLTGSVISPHSRREHTVNERRQDGRKRAEDQNGSKRDIRYDCAIFILDRPTADNSKHDAGREEDEGNSEPNIQDNGGVQWVLRRR